MKKKPVLQRKCRQCGQWFSKKRLASKTQKFCTVGCAAAHRGADPRWRKAHSERLKGKCDPEMMRERARSIWRNPELRARLTENSRQRANTQEHHDRMIKHNKKIWSDPEFRRRHTERTKQQTKKQWNDPAFRKKILAASVKASRERWADPEYKKRVSASIRAAKAKPEAKARQSEIMRERAQKPEWIALQREKLNKLWRDPAYRTKMSEQSRMIAERNWLFNPSYRAKKTAVLKKWAQSPENRARLSALNKTPEATARRKAWWTVERRIALTEENERRWSDPKFKKRTGRRISKAKRRNANVRKAAKKRALSQ
jgi:hypothetical protein